MTLPRAGARARGRGRGARAAPVDRAAAARVAAAARARSSARPDPALPRARARARRGAGPHARAPPRRRAARPGRPTARERSSAGTGAGARRVGPAARRRGRRRWASLSAACRSAPSARAGGAAPRRARSRFNWRLLLAPEEILDYVVWHEACHLAVMDHSPRFWGLLERQLPGYREPRALAAPQRRRAAAVSAPRRGRRSSATSSTITFAVVRAPAGARRDRAFERDLRGTRPAAARSPPCRWPASPAPRLLLTALGDDELGRAPPRRAALARRRESTPLRARATRDASAAGRTSITGGERTITILDPRVVPHGDDGAAVGPLAGARRDLPDRGATPTRARGARRARPRRRRRGPPTRSAKRRRARRARAERERSRRGAWPPRVLDPAPRWSSAPRAPRAAAVDVRDGTSGALGGGPGAGAARRLLRLRRLVRRRAHLRARVAGLSADEALALAARCGRARSPVAAPSVRCSGRRG